MSLEDFFARLEAGDTKTLNLIVRADVQGKLSPVVQSLEQLGRENAEVDVKILQAAIGNVTESDVMLAEVSNGIILAFNTRIDPAAAKRADASGVEIRTYNIIYQLLEDATDKCEHVATVMRNVIVKQT